MASTYTPLLNIEMPANGDQAGSWGTTINSNMNNILEQAIAGTAAITVTSPTTTLTFPTQTAYAVLNLTGTLTAATAVVCPTKSKLYVVYNGTSGAYALTFKTPSGTGIVVPQGSYMFLYCDGTNVNSIAGGLNFQSQTLITTAAGTTTLTVSSTYEQIFQGTTTQTCVLPVVSTLSLGPSFWLKNESTGIVTVNSSGGNLVASLNQGDSILVTCILITGTTAASWDLDFKAQRNGDVSQTFLVAPATLAGHAVRSSQVSADNTNFPVYSTGTFTGTTTTTTTSPTATINYVKIGGRVTLSIPTAFANATKDGTSGPILITGLPVALQPSGNRVVYGSALINGVVTWVYIAITSSGISYCSTIGGNNISTGTTNCALLNNTLTYLI